MIALVLLLSTSLFALEIDFQLSSQIKGQMKKDVLKATQVIRETLEDDLFWEEVQKVKDFTCLEPPYEDPRYVLNYLQDLKLVVPVSTYWHAKKKVKAKTTNKKVYLNRRNKNRSYKAWANTLLHEALHVAGIGHCGVNNKKKYPYIKDSIPYKLGSLLETFISDEAH